MPVFLAASPNTPVPLSRQEQWPRQKELWRAEGKSGRLPALGELGVLVVQVLGGADGMEEGPVAAACHQGGREDDAVEGNVVLAHELVELHVLGVLPPLCERTADRQRW